MRKFINIITENDTEPSEELVDRMTNYVSTMNGISVSLHTEDDHEVSLQRLYVIPEYRRTNLATEFMTRLIETADELSVSLFLEAIPEWHDDEDEETGLPSQPLMAFYAKFGFSEDGGSMMSREPS